MVKSKTKMKSASKLSKQDNASRKDAIKEHSVKDSMEIDELQNIQIKSESLKDEEEVIDEVTHKKLLKSFGINDKKKKKIKERVLHVDPAEKDVQGKMTVSDLLSSVAKTSTLKSVEKLLENTKNKDIKTLDEPLPRFQREQAEREVNYDKAKQEVTKWQPIVKRNRETEHMAFPLFHAQATKIREDVTSFANKRSKPSNDLEAEVYAVLEAQQHYLERPDTFLTEAEETTLEKLNAEEAEQRRQELSKMRALLSYHEEKFRRKKKIKSKKYHKILKKERQKKDEKQMVEELKDNPGNMTKEAEKADYLRALERMSQKHKVGGKWNKNLLHKNIKDPELKKALKEQQQLRQKIMEKAEESEKSEEETDRENIVKKEEKQAVTDQPISRTEEEAFEVDNNNPWLIVRSALTGQSVAAEALEPLTEDRVHRKLEEEPESDSKSEHEVESIKPMNDREEDIKLMNDRNEDPKTVDLLQEKDAVDQEALIDMAFANDDVVAQFVAEKQKIVDEDTEKDVDLTLPGWGSWSGAGVQSTKPKKRIIKKAPPQQPRRDAKLDHVIINIKKNRKLEPHLVKNLPHPYKSKEVLERELRHPIGPQWNSIKAFKNMIKPAVSTIDGHIIAPIVEPKGFDKVKIKRKGVK